jgi:hypothetical protein
MGNGSGGEGAQEGSWVKELHHNWCVPVGKIGV